MTREARKPKKEGMFKKRKRKPCFFCIEKVGIDYKDVPFVKRFMTDRGKIAPRRMSGCCALHQRMVAAAIKRSRQIGLVPYVVD
ncbi:MAG: 30S ribosomal protein S18 [Candidatus Margulisiibacteriota bacterium]|jgi:small subunit ribosomal protein S18